MDGYPNRPSLQVSAPSNDSPNFTDMADPKTKSNLNPTFMKDIFVVKNSYYSLRNPNHFQLPNVRTTIYGIENIQFRGCSLWSSLPNSMKNSEPLQEFKRRIKHWDEISCNCRLCKVFIKDIGFLN